MDKKNLILRETVESLKNKEITRPEFRGLIVLLDKIYSEISGGNCFFGGFVGIHSKEIDFFRNGDQARKAWDFYKSYGIVRNEKYSTGIHKKLNPFPKSYAIRSGSKLADAIDLSDLKTEKEKLDKLSKNFVYTSYNKKSRKFEFENIDPESIKKMIKTIENITVDVDKVNNAVKTGGVNKEDIKSLNRLTKGGTIKKTPNSGRIYSPLSSTTRVARKFLLIDGKPLAEADMKTSIIYWAILDIRKYENDNDIPNEDRISDKMFKDYNNDKIDFYENLIQKSNKNLSRDELKKQLMSLLGTKKEHNRAKLDLYNVMVKEYPLIKQYFLDYYKKNNDITNMMRYQQFESSIMIDVVCKRLEKDNRVKFYAPLHDAIYCDEDSLQIVRETIVESFKEAVGYSPRVSGSNTETIKKASETIMESTIKQNEYTPSEGKKVQETASVESKIVNGIFEKKSEEPLSFDSFSKFFSF